jgi:TolB-like protein/Tfp pilus assembly protein PilF
VTDDRFKLDPVIEEPSATQDVCSEIEGFHSSDDLLDSWKEIAVCLGRDVRTVQRWEKSEGLPVRRHVHEKQGTVYAYKHEIDEWRKRRQRVGLPFENEEVPAETSPATVETDMDAGAMHASKRSFLRWPAPLLIGVLALGMYYFSHRNVSVEQGHPVTIAVLPFGNLSADPSQEYFSDGITEELIVQLGKLQAAGMHPIAVGSSSNYKNSTQPLPKIAAALGAEYVVQGSVRRSGDRVRVSAHLIHARDGRHIWDESYDREMKDVLALQSDVAEAIAQGLSGKLVPRRSSPARAVNPDAYEAYLRGRFFWNKRSPQELFHAMEEFHKAIQIDPSYAPAYVGLADCYTLLGSAQMGVLPPTDAMPKAKSLAEKALALDPELAEAHASLAHVILVFDRDGDKAEDEFLRAIQLNPGYATAHQWYALDLNAVGRPADALIQLEQSQRLDPLSPAIHTALSEAHYFNRQYEPSIEEARKALEINSEFTLGYLNLGRSLEQLGRHDEAIAAYEKGRELSAKGPAMTTMVARVYAFKGDKNKSRELLGDLLKLPNSGPHSMYVPSLYIATIYNALGENDTALTYLKKALAEGCEYLIYLDRDPMADSIRQDSRFQPVLREARLKVRMRYVPPKLTQ